MKSIVVCENVVKTFGEGKEQFRALNGVSIEIGQGEFIAVMGPSGSGKSTLMYALSGMDRPNSGLVYFSGKNLSQLKDDELADIRRTKMGFVFQQPTMLRNLSILDNIVLPSLRENRRNKTAISQKARDLMKKTGISGLESRDVTQVSGGQLQRAGICRALMNRPDIIFGDEPTGALNSKAADDIMELMADINADGTAIMLVTHDARVAARAQRVLFMRDGEIASELRFAKYEGRDMENRLKSITGRMGELSGR
ncbi:MAG TPA: ABC transporter ATP-binding protein [Candidatus Acidoferrum sp.]|nr:ABC transporter ATP-binding protein [Candidatus Acidoferrum sp.]